VPTFQEILERQARGEAGGIDKEVLAQLAAIAGAGQEGVPFKTPSMENLLKAGVYGATLPFEALDEASLGLGGALAEEAGRAGAALEQKGIPGAGALGSAGAALGMVPFAASQAMEPFKGAGKAAKGAAKAARISALAGQMGEEGGLLGKLSKAGLPDEVLRKAEALKALHGEEALGKIVREYESKGVPLFSHDLPMDEASRAARAAEGGFNTPAYHGTGRQFLQFDAGKEKIGSAGGFFGSSPETASIYAGEPGLTKLPFGNVRQNNPQVLPVSFKEPQKGVWQGDVRVFDPSAIRSQYAAFDPRMKDSRFLLAAQQAAAPTAAGIGLAEALKLFDQRKQEER